MQITQYPEYPQVHSFWMTFINQMFKLQREDPDSNPGSNIPDNQYEDPELQ
jgi:hypothetical protein